MLDPSLVGIHASLRGYELIRRGAFMGAVYSGFCTVQSSSMAAPTAELIDMISIGGVNRLVLYASYLSTHIKVAKHDNHVAQALASCRQILHTGVALPKDDEEWAIQNNLKITVCISSCSALYS